MQIMIVLEGGTTSARSLHAQVWERWCDLERNALTGAKSMEERHRVRTTFSRLVFMRDPDAALKLLLQGGFDLVIVQDAYEVNSDRQWVRFGKQIPRKMSQQHLSIMSLVYGSRVSVREEVDAVLEDGDPNHRTLMKLLRNAVTMDCNRFRLGNFGLLWLR